MSKSYNILALQNYISGRLDAGEMYQLEREALEDPLLQDALDGFMGTEAISHSRLSLLQKRLEHRIVAQREERNILHFTWQRLAIASVACTLFIVAVILFWMINTPSKNAEHNPSSKEVEVLLTNPISASLEEGNIEPLNGWKEYNHYLSTKHQDELTGQKVVIHFEVSAGKPIDIKIISAASEQAGIQASYLIKQGPKWKGESGTVNIVF